MSAIPSKVRNNILYECGNQCTLFSCQSNEIQIHHMIPVAGKEKWNGPTEPYNLIALCPSCHSSVGRLENRVLTYESINLDELLIDARKYLMRGNLALSLKLVNLYSFTRYIRKEIYAALVSYIQSVLYARGMNMFTECAVILKNHKWIITDKFGYMTIEFPMSKKRFVIKSTIRTTDYLRAIYMKELIAFIMDKHYAFRNAYSNNYLLSLINKVKKTTKDKIDIDNVFREIYCAMQNRLLVLDNNKEMDVLCELSDLQEFKLLGNTHLSAGWNRFFNKQDTYSAVQELEKGIEYKRYIPKWTIGELIFAKGFILVESKKDLNRGMKCVIKGSKILKECGVVNLSTPSFWLDEPLNYREYLKKVLFEANIPREKLIELILG